jgi:hypothetical protein
MSSWYLSFSVDCYAATSYVVVVSLSLFLSSDRSSFAFPIRSNQSFTCNLTGLVPLIAPRPLVHESRPPHLSSAHFHLTSPHLVVIQPSKSFFFPLPVNSREQPNPDPDSNLVVKKTNQSHLTMSHVITTSRIRSSSPGHHSSALQFFLSFNPLL